MDNNNRCGIKRKNTIDIIIPDVVQTIKIEPEAVDPIESEIITEDEYSGAVSQEQPVLSRTVNNIERQTNSPVNTGIISLLKEILEGQKSILSRMDKMEGLVNIVAQNQQNLSNRLLTINNRLLKMEKRMVEDSASLKAENIAQAKILMENNVAIKTVNESLCRMTGETSDKAIDDIEKAIDEIASLIPLRTIEAVEEVEENLGSDDFVKAMATYVQKVKGVSEDVGDVIRIIFSDDLLEVYNWDGRCKKGSLESLRVFGIIRDAFQKQGSLRFEKDVKKAVERAHHRVKQKRYLQSKKS